MSNELSARLPLPSSAQLVTVAGPGQLCVLVMSQAMLSGEVLSQINDLERVLGGSRIEPLHVTCDRFVSAGDWREVAESLRRHAANIPPVVIRAGSAIRVDRNGRPDSVVKFVVDETDELSAIRLAVESVRLEAGIASAYARPTRFTVSVLTGVSDAMLPERIEPLDLFLADQFLLSRIVDVDEFEILEAVKLAA